MTSGRNIKRFTLDLLGADTWEDRLPELLGPPSRRVINPLFSALLHPDPLIKWHAVTGFGVLVPAMAEQSMEQARVVMRRFLWMLNEESGGIGWGIAEAMAEVLANHESLAGEYHTNLLAYIHEDECRPDCFLEHCLLRRGAVWGVARLALVRPEMAAPAADDLLCQLSDADPYNRGYACWGLGLLGHNEAGPRLDALGDDFSRIELYRNRVLETVSVSALAREALTRL
ncbi:MAG TPA: HEAT repeat domain-containing protein [Desulfomicrobiaceae bacterium]|nr:HEAT repeat domain-containing protein [Desulfomicrobiaceae bacterium]